MPDIDKAQEARIKAFQDELASLIDKVRAKRKELMLLSEHTIETFDRRVNEARAKMDVLNDELASLEQVVDKKRAEASADFDSARKSLISEYDQKASELQRRVVSINEREQSVMKRETEANIRIEAAEFREAEANRLAENFRRSKADLESRIHQFDSDCAARLSEIDAKERKATALVDEATAGLESVRKQKHSLDEMIAEYHKKSSDADATIARISEVQAILDRTEQNIKKNDEREATLNELDVRLKAEKLRINRCNEDLASREKQLSKREENIRILEAGKV